MGRNLPKEKKLSNFVLTAFPVCVKTTPPSACIKDGSSSRSSSLNRNIPSSVRRCGRFPRGRSEPRPSEDPSYGIVFREDPIRKLTRQNLWSSYIPNTETCPKMYLVPPPRRPAAAVIRSFSTSEANRAHPYTNSCTYNKYVGTGTANV